MIVKEEVDQRISNKSDPSSGKPSPHHAEHSGEVVKRKETPEKRQWKLQWGF